MILSEEVYFDITLIGTKGEIKRFVKFVKGDGLGDFIDCAADLIGYSDDYDDASDSDASS